MSYPDLRDLLGSIFSDLNASNSVPTLQQAWNAHAADIAPLLGSPEMRDEFTSLDGVIHLPKALEAARLLQMLRQRFSSEQRRVRPLVGRIRAEVVLRERPRRDRPRETLTGEARAIANLAPTSFSEFASFQVDGWSKVSRAMNAREGLAIVAPTGGGKTEVFLMPVIHGIAQALRAGREEVPRFVLLYPRVTLLKDQLSRIFRYTHNAGQNIVIGFQFSGISSEAQKTRENRQVFDADGTFRIVEQCPVCDRGALKVFDNEPRRGGITMIRCDACRAAFRTSISKNDHTLARPHLMVTTVESLDRLYLTATDKFDNYLRLMTGVIFDEVHLFQSIYGAHIYNVIRRIEGLQNGRPLTKIAASATISSPERFTAKLFYGDENHPVTVHRAEDYDQVPAGLEVLYFLQSPEEQNRPGAAPTLIQSVMALGHGVLKGDDRALVFTESLDMVGRLQAQIRDAEWQGRLWNFRTDVPSIEFQGSTCPRTNPAACPDVYQEGECWRGVLGGYGCHQHVDGLRDRALDVVQVSSRQRSRYWEGDVVVATSALEVGVDDERIKATVHYLPPRTVFSFTQRRGRAGRSLSETAYTLMVLGNTPSDHFYFFRRNRLVHGTYDLPLNPQNPIVREMHDRSQAERERVRLSIRRNDGVQKGIWRWVWETLSNCSMLRNRYSSQLAQLNEYPGNRREHDALRQTLREWISREKRTLENHLSLRYVLHEIELESPDQLRSVAREVQAAFDAFLAGEVEADEVEQKVIDLQTGLITLSVREKDDEASEHLERVREKVMSVWRAARQQPASVGSAHAERLYNFFRALEKLCSKDYVLNSAPDAVKAVLQAMFYLHLGLEDGEEPGVCESGVDYFIPDSYFQEVKPVVVEAYQGAGRPPELHQESVTDLASMLIPYKPVYRYYGHPLLSVLDTEHDPDLVDHNSGMVRVRLKAEGVRREGALAPQKVSVRSLQTDDRGQQLVKICPQCYALYSINRRRPCHTRLEPIRLYTEPVVRREYEVLSKSSISRTIDFLEDVLGSTMVLGSSVKARKAIWNPQRGEYVPGGGSFGFEARYELPLRYGLSTKGIVWNLKDVTAQLLREDQLRHEVEQVSISGSNKRLDEHMVLHTAAHMLHKTVASISGVNEQTLEYHYNPGRREAAVWERYEGGSGISETFVSALRADPTDIYRELLSSILCPVNLAERQDWTSSDDLLIELTEHWCMSPEDGLVIDLVREAEAERRAQSNEDIRLLCRPPQGHDGCPACIHATYCTRRDEQDVTVSRLVGEAILRCLVRRLGRGEAEAATNEAIAREIVAPSILIADPLQGAYDTLLL